MMISIILPCFNEENNVNKMYERLLAALKNVVDDYELIFIDDGSTDHTLSKLTELCKGDGNIKILEFSRNFGHQAAICAGLDYAKGDAVVMMDADLQHPPELIPSLLQKWYEGYEIVYTIRNDPADISLFKKVTARLFYKLINALAKINVPENSADFRLLDKAVVKQLGTMTERTKFFRGLISWVGFKQYPVYYEAAPRFTGDSKYTLWKMVKFALDGITSFSAYPLHVATIIGLLVSTISFLYAAYAIYAKLFTQEALPGWTSVLVAVLFLGGIQLLSLGIIGEYLGRTFEEMKGRPPYIIRTIIEHEAAKDSC